MQFGVLVLNHPPEHPALRLLRARAPEAAVVEEWSTRLTPALSLLLREAGVLVLFGLSPTDVAIVRHAISVHTRVVILCDDERGTINEALLVEPMVEAVADAQELATAVLGILHALSAQWFALSEPAKLNPEVS